METNLKRNAGKSQNKISLPHVPYYKPYHKHSMPYHLIRYHAMPYNAKLYHTMQYHYYAIPCHAMPYHAIPYNSRQINTIPCRTIIHLLVPYSKPRANTIIWSICPPRRSKHLTMIVGGGVGWVGFESPGIGIFLLSANAHKGAC